MAISKQHCNVAGLSITGLINRRRHIHFPIAVEITDRYCRGQTASIERVRGSKRAVAVA